jgi:hypothetical protein
VAGAGSEGDTSPPLVHALDVAEGTLQWSRTIATGTDPQWPTPTIVGDLLLVAATPNPQVQVGNQVHALRLADGSEVWSADLGGNQGFSSRATAVSDDLLHVTVAGVGVVTLDIARGAVAHTIEDSSFSTPVQAPCTSPDTPSPPSCDPSIPAPVNRSTTSHPGSETTGSRSRSARNGPSSYRPPPPP